MTERHPTTWILVCDGARARVWANRGSGTGLTAVSAAENPGAHSPTRDLGTDKPGRSQDSSGLGGRHAVAPPVDWHRFEKEKFAREMAAVVNKAALAGEFDRLVIAAPPHTLGDLRKALDAHAAAKVTGEINKDLTQLGAHDLAAHLGDLVRL